MNILNIAIFRFHKQLSLCQLSVGFFLIKKFLKYQVDCNNFPIYSTCKLYELLTSGDDPFVHGLGLWGEGHQIKMEHTPYNVIGSQVYHILLLLKILPLQGLCKKIKPNRIHNIINKFVHFHSLFRCFKHIQ